MDLTFGSRIKHAFNAFMNRDPTPDYRNIGPGYSVRPDRPRFTRGNERTIVTSIYNRIAIDVASINISHCRIDDDNRFVGAISSSLNNCLNLEANIDQTGRAFMQDVVMSMLDEGSVAIVPVETTFDPSQTKSYDILSMRTGKILEWHPNHVKVRVYNDRTGEQEEIMLRKDQVAIVENPLYAVINEHNSTMQRLMRKLSLLNYHSRTIEPIISAIVDEMKRKFLTKTARSQKQTIMFFKDPFKLVPLNTLANVAGVFTMNEIITANEVRQIIGMKPSDDPKADQLVNSNINQTGMMPMEPEPPMEEGMEESPEYY